jgi:hypothetical protein
MESNRLSGWKEIATHLRRSVRAAQRWEQELGLPVHRIKTAQGQMVFADRQELDAWMRGLETGSVVVPETSAVQVEVEPTAHMTRLPQARLMLWAGSIVVLVATTAFGIARALPAEGSNQVATTLVNGNVVEARNEGGQQLWEYEFAEDVSRLDLGMMSTDSTHSVAAVDVDGDGSVDQILAARSGSSLLDFRKSDTVIVFSNAGAVLWSATVPDAYTVTCGSQVFSGPWQLSAVLVSSDSGPKRTWLAFNHHTDWPALVIQVDAEGTQSVRYIQAGWIKGLAEDKTTGRTLVAAAGVVNARNRASLTTFDPSQAITTLPQEDSPYSCEPRARAGPVRVILFPQHDVTTGLGYGYHLASSVSPVGSSLRVVLDGTAVGLVDAVGRVTKITFDDSYWLRHETLERERRILHSASQCPHLTQPHRIQTWTPESGWGSYTVPPERRPALASTQ